MALLGSDRRPLAKARVVAHLSEEPESRRSGVRKPLVQQARGPHFWRRGGPRFRKGLRHGSFIVVSCVLHVSALALGLQAESTKKLAPPFPTVAVTFIEAEAAPPPAPPVSPETLAPAAPPLAETSQPRVVAQKSPTQLPSPPDVLKQELPTIEATPNEAPPVPVAVANTDKSQVGGVVGGVPGGTTGGRVGGVVSASASGQSVAPPAPQPPPPPAMVDVEYARKRRTAGKDPPYPPRAERDGVEGLVVVKVVIDPKGIVSQATILRGHPAFDDTVRKAIAGWRFAPHVVNGTAVAVFTVFRFTFRLS